MPLRNEFPNLLPFELLQPAEQRVPFVFNSPHSGAYYPATFLASSHLDTTTIRTSEDAFVDELYLSSILLGAPLLRAHFPRAYLDVNRQPYELDQRMFEEKLPSYTNAHSVRVAAGLGTIPRIVSEGKTIYPGKIPLKDAFDRIELLYKPYHHALQKLLIQTRDKFGFAVLIDCHSMPSGMNFNDQPSRADFIIGDRFGRSCSNAFAAEAIFKLQDLGFDVAYNKPYAGGYITENYGNPSQGFHAIQIELNRALYMDESTIQKKAGFNILQSDLYGYLAELTSLPDSIFSSPPLAAE